MALLEAKKQKQLMTEEDKKAEVDKKLRGDPSSLHRKVRRDD
jgi:hypothetical protein